MKQISTETKTFYYMEVSQEVYDRLRYGCMILDQMYNGNLDAVRKMAFDAYRARTGEEVSPEMMHNISDCIQGIQAWGWDKPMSEGKNQVEESMLYRDIFQTLDFQQKLLGLDHNRENYPEHLCKNIPLLRIINVLPVKQKRNKPLKTFCSDFSKRRRI